MLLLGICPISAGCRGTSATLVDLRLPAEEGMARQERQANRGGQYRRFLISHKFGRIAL